MKRCVCKSKLVMMRTRGIVGPLAQNVGGRCALSVGSAYAVNGPLGAYITHNGEFVTHDGERVTHDSTGVK